MSESRYSSGPLTEAECREIRRIIESDGRARWFWATARTWAVWVAAVVGGLTLGWDFVKKILRAATGV